MAGYQQLHSTRPDERFCQNIFWVNCFFHQFLIFVEKIVKSWKKKLVRVVIRFFFVSRGTISGKNYFLEKFTLIHPSDLDCKKKFNCRRKSFTIDAAGSFYVFRGNFSGKQVVLEKHKNFHQFWILKQNSIENSQKTWKQCQHWPLSAELNVQVEKVFYCVQNISVFLNCCWSLTEKNWKFFRKRHGRVAKTAFYVSRGKIFGKTIFLGKLFSFQFLIVKEKIMTPAKDFNEGCLKSTLRFQLIAFTIKTFFEIFLLLHLFRTSSGKNFQLSKYILCKAVNVHSTYSDEHFLEKSFFLGKTIKFHPFRTWKQKYFENSWKLSKNNVYTE